MEILNTYPGRPKVAAPTFAPAPARNMCTDCGVSRMEDPSACGSACQFIAPDYPKLEQQVHGAPRDETVENERFFGPHLAMYKAALREPAAGAQWTGLTTRLAQRLLEVGQVDAVLAMAPDPDDRWQPRPVIVTDPVDMALCRGMRMGYAPLLALLEPAKAAGYKRIAVVGIPCQIYALRALERELGFDKLVVIGTPCSDNTTTENFHHFLSVLTDHPETVSYCEFRADYKVELRFDDGGQRLIPFLQLPLSDLPADFFPLTCRTCVDYTNALADITVGYMAGQGDQWLIVRNARGQAILDAIGDEVRLEPLQTRGKRRAAVAGFKTNTELAAGGLPLRRMPKWVRPIVSWLQPRTGPQGLEFAKARLEMKAIESILHLRAKLPKRVRHLVPSHVWKLAAPYGLEAEPEELPRRRAD
ncbi:MAG: Coenzyme F420 hydrogenase/dehydrogenase, beta subunit C-terminal domain [Pseudomonadota bacterium]